MKFGSLPEVPALLKTCVSSKNYATRYIFHKLEKHESIAYIMHEESRRRELKHE